MGEEIARSFAHFSFLQGGETSMFSSILTILRMIEGSNKLTHCIQMLVHTTITTHTLWFGRLSNTNGGLSFVADMSMVQTPVSSLTKKIKVWSCCFGLRTFSLQVQSQTQNRSAEIADESEMFRISMTCDKHHTRETRRSGLSIALI